MKKPAYRVRFDGYDRLERMVWKLSYGGIAIGALTTNEALARRIIRLLNKSDHPSTDGNGGRSSSRTPDRRRS